PHHPRLIRAIPRGGFMSPPTGHIFPPERPREIAALLKGVFDCWPRAPEERSA
ncbi:alpha/beta hydrolase, partial [Pseudomonas aeruginosa]|nr:alpha/beta hydrolase [Pseudomonas aeruginosa]